MKIRLADMDSVPVAVHQIVLEIQLGWHCDVICFPRCGCNQWLSWAVPTPWTSSQGQQLTGGGGVWPPLWLRWHWGIYQACWQVSKLVHAKPLPFFFFGDIATTYYIADPESNWPCEKLESKGLDWNSTHTATEHISRSSEICIVSFPDLFIHSGAGLGLGQRLRHHREFCLNLVPAVFPHRADLDPIYYCELLHLCPVKDDGDAKITSLTVNPTSVPRGIGHQGYV